MLAHSIDDGMIGARTVAAHPQAADDPAAA
jgi:hypothetical protein